MPAPIPPHLVESLADTYDVPLTSMHLALTEGEWTEDQVEDLDGST